MESRSPPEEVNAACYGRLAVVLPWRRLILTHRAWVSGNNPSESRQLIGGNGGMVDDDLRRIVTTEIAKLVLSARSYWSD
jgi:hypothetical protein